ncbi:ABC transporter substrate-binding protein [Cognatishimia maritima]|uniref:Peptide/nickel transport system substrate-binding protein n=1 Tax=Cognatishimia maritima TaxID=870908 RepID=A0A1M5QVU2_9RHOB|nr:ABC transporter substrate-binding protein [Cognatishimia maritima]SHH18297.1 peptide/nickel transport system substrate-binding protein [Cognatishimia maritima]
MGLQFRMKGILAASVATISLAGMAMAEGFKEAPALAEMVAAGKLPSVEERLPSEPMVMEVLDSIGEYGGTLRRAILGGGDQHNMVRLISNENLVRWSADWSEVKTNIAESYEASADATTYTFKLREGMKWSDGAPFTADDIMFWNEVFNDKRLTPVQHSNFVGASGPVQVTKIDDYTVEFKFGEPNGLFLQNMAYGFGYYVVNYPAHYLKQFHIDHNPDIQALVDAEPAATDWISLFNLKAGPMHTPLFWQNADRPTLHPWHIVEGYGSTERMVAERNPYYWKVDAEGQQLPYIDRVTWDQVEDPESILLKAFNGEIDYMARHIGRSSNLAALTDNKDRGQYGFYQVADIPANVAILMFNLNNPDPIKNEIVNNIDFRKAVSHAVDRQEIIDLVYLGDGTPAQTAPHKVAPFYQEKWVKQFTEFDPDKANELLDSIGLDKRDSDGYRLGPDGERFTLVFLVADVFGLQYPDVMELVAEYASNVGLDFQVRSSDRGRLQEITASGEHDAYIWNCGGGQVDAYTNPYCYVPVGTAVHWAPKWVAWGVGAADGIEPPEHIKKLFETYEGVTTTADPEKQLAALNDLIEQATSQLLTVGLVQSDGAFGIARNNLRNYPDPMPIAGQLWTPAPYTAQFYFEGGDNLK